MTRTPRGEQGRRQRWAAELRPLWPDSHLGRSPYADKAPRRWRTVLYCSLAVSLIPAALTFRLALTLGNCPHSSCTPQELGSHSSGLLLIGWITWAILCLATWAALVLTVGKSHPRWNDYLTGGATAFWCAAYPFLAAVPLLAIPLPAAPLLLWPVLLPVTIAHSVWNSRRRRELWKRGDRRVTH